MPIGKFFGRLANTVAPKLVNLDELQAVIAGGVLVSNSDGGIGSDELDQLQSSIFTNEAMASFEHNDIAKIINDSVAIIRAGAVSGKMRLKKEMLDVAKNPEVVQRVFAACCDIAAKGEEGTSPKEKAMLVEIAGWYQITNLADFDLA